ncbi:glycosyl hydrolases family 31-domain-containing protein [Phycomyces nitens]|nr:glycosyl hydrolases family 31-domain-containing protein [Phycomyces nitens]
MASKEVVVPPSRFALTKSVDGEEVEIETPELRIVIELKQTHPPRLVWYSSGEEVPFAQDLLYRSVAYDPSSESVWHYQTSTKGDRYYGLGEKTGKIDLSGRRFRLERMDCMGYDARSQDPLYKFCPFYITLGAQSKVAHGIYYNNFSDTTIDFGQEIDAMWGPYIYYQAASGPLDYYRVYGPTVSNVVKSYGTLMGRPRHLPPRYAFGYLASSMGYAEADNAQEKLEAFGDLCKEHSIPCDGMHLSSGYTVNGAGDRCVFTWNSKRFPDPRGLAAHLKAAGIRIFANVKPWLLKTHPDYALLKVSHGLVWNPDEMGPATLWQWSAGRNTAAEASYIDFTSLAGYRYWQDRLKTRLLDLGYELWLDNNEFTMLDDTNTYACEMQPTSYQLTKLNLPTMGPRDSTARSVGTPYQTLLMMQASYEAVRKHAPIDRPFLITRSATPFSHQLMSQTWSGDNTTDWSTIEYNVPMGLGAGLSVMPGGYGHDVGGFAGPRPSPEMFVRWVQQAIFWPRFCIHSWNTDGTITEPWMYPEVLPLIRASIELRYRLIPYLYSLYIKYFHRQCEPVIRPVFYDHQQDPNTHTQSFEFMVGSDLLIAPVIQPDQISRTVYLPAHTGWYHYQTNTYYDAPEQGLTVTVPSVMEDTSSPMFVKAGAILCFGKVMSSVFGDVDDERRIQVFPHPTATTRTEFHLFEDDGKTIYYENGAYADVVIWMESNATEIRVGIEILEDGYFPNYDTLWVTCPLPDETRPLVFDGEDDFGRIMGLVDQKDTNLYEGFRISWNRPQDKQ